MIQRTNMMIRRAKSVNCSLILLSTMHSMTDALIDPICINVSVCLCNSLAFLATMNRTYVVSTIDETIRPCYVDFLRY